MARKSGSTILQEELYPPSAEPRARTPRSTHDLDDARLVDLDVDEESPFLRGQKRVSARRSSLPKKTANWLLWAASGCRRSVRRRDSARPRFITMASIPGASAWNPATTLKSPACRT